MNTSSWQICPVLTVFVPRSSRKLKTSIRTSIPCSNRPLGSSFKIRLRAIVNWKNLSEKSFTVRWINEIFPVTRQRRFSPG